MSGQFYDGGKLSRTYRFAAASLAAAAVVGRIQGPAGKTGIVRGIEYVITTGVTVAAGTVTVANNGSANPCTVTVEVAGAASGGAATAAELSTFTDGAAGRELAADTIVEVAAGGEPTAGAADLIVTVDWY